MGLQFQTGDKRKDKILFEISEMKYHDLKRECILRGMDFDLLINGDFPRNSNWLLHHWDVKKVQSRLKDFDAWMDSQLKQNGYKKKHPLRQYKQMTVEEKPESEKPKKLPKPEKPKVKREKDQKYGIYTGTKKELVYQLSQKLLDQLGTKYDNKALVKKFTPQVMQRVDKKFPGAVNEKSIRIWMKRALDSIRK